jgi:hypothetical protein
VTSSHLCSVHWPPLVTYLHVFPVYGTPLVTDCQVCPVHGPPLVTECQVCPVHGPPLVTECQVCPVHWSLPLMTVPFPCLGVRAVPISHFHALPDMQNHNLMASRFRH